MQFFAPAIAAAVCIGVMVILLENKMSPLDQPNERSLHSKPVPRSGGIAIMAGTLVAVLMVMSHFVAAWLAAILSALSFIDDRHSLSALIRLAVHFSAGATFLVLAGAPSSILVFLALLFAIVWLTNLFNFMDGSDGLAGGMAVIGFGTYGIAAILAGGNEIGFISLSVAAAAAGFLIFNFPPARIFMGDVGSIPLGFLAATIGVLGWTNGLWPISFPLVVFAPFILDATVTLFRRALRKERIWQAHRDHYYQRLVLSGWTHGRLAIAEYAIMLVCAVSAVTLTLVPRVGVVPISLGVALILVALMIMVDRRWRLFSRTDHA